MADLNNASQEVTLTDETTGSKCNPNSDGSLPVTLVGATGSTRINPATEESLAKLTVTQGTALGTKTQALVGGSVTTAAPTYTTGQIQPLSLDLSGRLRVDATVAAASKNWIQDSVYSGYGFGAQVDALNVATTGTYNPIFILQNPAGSGRVLVVVRLASYSETASRTVRIETRVSPTVTAAGVAMTTGNLLAGSVTAPVGLPSYLPTMTGGVGIWERLVNDVGIVNDIGGVLQILPGSAIGIFAWPSQNNVPISFAINWTEVLQ